MENGSIKWEITIILKGIDDQMHGVWEEYYNDKS